MIDTKRIRSGFDAELMLGKGWFLTAIQTLTTNGILNLPLGITIIDVDIIDDSNWDFDFTTSLGGTLRARITIENSQFVFEINFIDPETHNNITFNIAIPNMKNVSAQSLKLIKIMGDDMYENALALLFNLNLCAYPQDYLGQPIAGPPRGNEDDAVPFLPKGQHIALGIARETFNRFANDCWNTRLRAEDGSHPLPSPNKKKIGDWKKVKASVTKKRIKFTVKGEVPVDVWPDMNVTFELELKPKLVNDKLTFSTKKDLDTDFGFWGDIMAYSIGYIVQMALILFTGGGAAVLLPASAGLVTVIYLEIGEAVAGEILERRIVVKDDKGNQLANVLCNEHILEYAYPKPSEDAIDISMLDAIPSSIPINVDDSDPLYDRMIIVKALYKEIAFNGDGLAVAGTSEPSELFQLRVARLVEAVYEGDKLKQLKYFVPETNNTAILDIETVYNRLKENELRPPLYFYSESEEAIFQIPSGKLCCPCMTPTKITRKDTVITHILFDTGLVLRTQDAISLQDSAGIYVKGLQLIHPKYGSPYYRSKANKTTDDNFETLPEYKKS